MIKSGSNQLNREEKSSRKSFMNFFQKYGKKRAYHMSGNMAQYVQFIRQGA
jgi:hypothetical protein